MKRTIFFTIPGKPIPQKRHRHIIKSTHLPHCPKSISYDPLKKEKTEIQTIMQHTVNQSYNFNDTLLQGPIHAIMRFYFQLPKTKQAQKNKGLYHDNLCDIDNLQKTYLDCLQGIAYRNDAQIYKMDATKYYTIDEPRTEISLREVQQQELIKLNVEPTLANGHLRDFLGATKLAESNNV